MYPKKLNLIEKIKLKSQFPKLDDKEIETANYKIVKKTKYELMEKMISRVDNYIEQIKICNQKIEKQELDYKELKNKIDDLNKLMKEKEKNRKKSASKIGGLQTSLNNQKEKNKLLLDLNKSLSEKLTKQEKELKEKTRQAEFFKNHRRAPSIEDYKNYINANHELEKRNKKEQKKDGTI